LLSQFKPVHVGVFGEGGLRYFEASDIGSLRKVPRHSETSAVSQQLSWIMIMISCSLESAMCSVRGEFRRQNEELF